jgi:hypothetical protein
MDVWVGRDRRARRIGLNADSLTVVQLPASQGIEKCRVIFELASNTAPNYFWFRFIPGQLGNQDVKAMIDSAALVMHDVIIASHGCPN